jgi:hypothetical protein
MGMEGATGLPVYERDVLSASGFDRAVLDGYGVVEVGASVLATSFCHKDTNDVTRLLRVTVGGQRYELRLCGIANVVGQERPWFEWVDRYGARAGAVFDEISSDPAVELRALTGMLYGTKGSDVDNFIDSVDVEGELYEA